MLHIRPWEIDLLTLNEFEGLCDYLDRRAAEMSERR